jgi:hypothetical protein
MMRDPDEDILERLSPPSPEEAVRRDARLTGDLGCQAQKLPELERFVEWFADAQGPQAKYERLLTWLGTFQRMGLRAFFQGLLTQYEMLAKDRKVIEQAARDVDRRYSSRVRFRTVGHVNGSYLTRLKKFRKFLAVAKQVIAKGKPIGTTACPVVGGFKLVNAGGFSPNVMRVVEDVVSQASKSMRDVGIESVIYGDINVVGSLRRGKALAHYDVPQDAVFIRANLRGRVGPAVRTVVHELAHRLEKMLSNPYALTRLYHDIQEEDEDNTERAIADRSLWPDPGFTFGDDGKWEVTSVEKRGRGEPRVRVRNRFDHRTGYYPMARFLKATGNLHASFVTEYARKNPSENFAEMVAAWCADELSDRDEARLLKAISEGLGA